MEIVEHIDLDGRKYKAYSDGGDVVIIGPPEGLVDEFFDELDVMEAFATRLHNILYQRGLLNYEEVVKSRGGLLGALQEALAIDVQKLNEVFYKYEKE